jgi:hypothetical protein
MTATLEKVFAEAAKLPAGEQEHFGPLWMEELALRKAIQEGVAAADAGRVRSPEEVEKLIPQWIAESSSPNRPSRI